MKKPKTRGATKVPNVKLRPAHASSSSKAQGHLPRVELPVDDATQGDFDFESGSKPFKGIVLCATGPLDKRTLFTRAQELGATRANDFTIHVTHLVADAPGSAKFRCAVERSLPILRESWVEEAYRTWLSGETVDLEKITTKHRLPIFTGVRLCLTGLDDLDMRGKIHSLLAKEGGVYLKSLDKTATHLLACASEESPKLKWASDYNETNRGDSETIHIVWEEWFWDSLEFGGLWDEREYVVANPRPSRKSVSEVVRSMDDISGENASTTMPLYRPIPLPSSLPTSVLLGEDAPEFGSVNKVPHARQILYDRIFWRREKEKDIPRAKDSDATNSQSASCSLLESATQREDIETTECSSKTHEPSAKHHPEIDSVLTRLANHRMNSFEHVRPSKTRQPFRRIVSSNSSIARELQESSSAEHSPSNEDKVSSLFEGYNFRAFGEAKSDNLRNALISHGGRWLADDEDEEASFLIVRLVSGEMYWRAEADYAERAKYRTECWIERCIFEERICSAEEHVVFTPLKIDTPVRGSEKLHVTISGLDTAEACWVKRLIRAIGANLVNNFSRQSTHLICPSGRGAKFDKANEWGVFVVGTEWLISIAMTGEIPDPKLFPVHPKVEEGSTTKQDINGKGKVKEAGKNDETIVDITNEIPQGRPPLKLQNSSYTYPDKLQSNTIRSESPRTRSTNGSTDAGSELRVEQTVGPQSRQIPSLSMGEMEVAPPSPPRIVPPSSSPLESEESKKANRTSQPFSVAEIPLDKHMTLIPSSHSPSPLEIPPKSATVSSPPIGEIRGLKTAITALLGKRSADSQDTTTGPVQKRQGRASKRPRPSSRKKSNLEPRRGPSPALYLLSGSTSFSCPPVHEDSELASEEAQPDLGVVYEDPDQRAEKRRLIALLEGGSMLDGSEIEGGENFITPAGVEDILSTVKRKTVRKTAKSSGS